MVQCRTSFASLTLRLHAQSGLTPVRECTVGCGHKFVAPCGRRLTSILYAVKLCIVEFGQSWWTCSSYNLGLRRQWVALTTWTKSPWANCSNVFFFSNSGLLTHSFVRDGSLLTSKQVQTHRLGFQHNNMDALPIVSNPLGFSDPAPTWKNYPRQSPDVGRDHQMWGRSFSRHLGNRLWELNIRLS